MKHNSFLAVLVLIVFASCKNQTSDFDATGSFEADETVISAEASGPLKNFLIEEGASMSKGAVIGYIDTVQLYLKKKQLQAQISAINSRLPNIAEQTSFYNQQIEVSRTKLNYLLKEQTRLQNLFQAKAATQKQLEDNAAQIAEVSKQMDVISQQKKAQVASLETQASGLKADPMPLVIQIEQVNDQLKRSVITVPFNGTLLSKYVKSEEMVTTGKPLFKMADMSSLFLRIYVTGNQLPLIKINQTVKVLTDNGSGGFNEGSGIITWINDKAEFTPKTIQTKEERANMVYAVKVKVVNDGKYKVGMYGQIKF
ncbi:HlyD family efflux transporter periplasmic adaptor subunit [Lacibacter sp. MH-610]|uniref:HlyD family secretion protein n=1 Tax=Lacibacter sp. MH-610 TaxID=3020883 RepID=UPI0038914226